MLITTYQIFKKDELGLSKFDIFLLNGKTVGELLKAIPYRYERYLYTDNIIDNDITSPSIFSDQTSRFIFYYQTKSKAVILHIWTEDSLNKNNLSIKLIEQQKISSIHIQNIDNL